MKKSNSIISEKELELGKYLESDMIELTRDEMAGGVSPTPATPLLSFISVFISDNTCPSSVCTRAC